MIAPGDKSFQAGDPIFNVVSGESAVFVCYTPESREYIACVKSRGEQVILRPGELDGYELLGESPKAAKRIRILKSLYPLPPGKRWLRKGDMFQAGDEWLSDPQTGRWTPIPQELICDSLDGPFLDRVMRGDEGRMSTQVEDSLNSAAFDWDAALDIVASNWAAPGALPGKKRKAKPRSKATPERAPGGRKFDAGM